jgi:hypothetical protein
MNEAPANLAAGFDFATGEDATAPSLAIERFGRIPVVREV